MTRISTKELARRGYRYGTPKEAWVALKSLSESVSSGQPVREDVALWLSNALKTNSGEDINELIRDLGFIEHGRTRIHNKFDLYDRMHELTSQKGLIKAEAARVCASEFGCHTETALYWFRKGVEVNGRANLASGYVHRAKAA